MSKSAIEIVQEISAFINTNFPKYRHESNIPSPIVIDIVAGYANTKEKRSQEEIMKQLLDRWGFHEDGAILCGEQLKIFSFMDWLKGEPPKEEKKKNANSVLPYV